MTAKRQWTPEEDRQMLEWHAAGVPQKIMAALLNSSRDGVSSRLQWLLADAGQAPQQGRTPTLEARARCRMPPPPSPSKPGGRRCLRCGHIFASAHGGHRLCNRCKARNCSTGPFDPS